MFQMRSILVIEHQSMRLVTTVTLVQKSLSKIASKIFQKSPRNQRPSRLWRNRLLEEDRKQNVGETNC